MDQSVQFAPVTDGTLRIALSGSITFTNSEQVRDAIRAAIAGDPPSLVLIDLDGVTFLDSSGVAALIMARRAANRVGGNLLVERPRPAVLEQLDLAGLTHLFGLRRPGRVIAPPGRPGTE